MKKYAIIFNYFVMRFTIACSFLIVFSILISSAAKNEPVRKLPVIKTLWVFPKDNLNEIETLDKDKKPEDIRIQFAPVLDESGENIFLASKKAVYKINSNDGMELKKRKLDHPPSIQILYGKSRIYICDKDNNILCLDADLNEKTIWNTKLQSTGCFSIQMTLIGLLCSYEDGTIRLLNPEQGDILWQCNIGEELKYSPAIDEQNSVFYVVGSKGSLFTIKLKNGTFVKNSVFEQKLVSPPIFFDGSLFMTFENGKFTAFDLKKFKNDWELSFINDIVAPAVGIDGMVCFSTLSNQVFCCDKDSGTLEGRFAGKQRFYLPPLIHENLIFAFGYYNGILAGNVEKGKPIGWIEHTGKPTAPALNLSEKKIILLVTNNSRLEALDYSDVLQSQLIEE